VPSRYRVPAGWLLGALVLVLARPTPRSLLLGLPLALLGEAVRVWASGHIEKTERLATGGPYAHSRNPLYVGSVLIALGVAAACASPWVVLATAAYFFAFYPSVMREEAAFLARKFPEEHAAWAAAVPLFWPRPTPAGPRASRFDWSRVGRNREWRTAAALPLVAGLLLVVALLLSAPVDPQPAPPAPSPVPASAATTAAPSTPPDTGPVAVPEPTEKAMRYYRTGNVVWAVDTLLGLLVPALFLFTGFSARIRDVARRVGRNWFFTIAVYFVLFSLATWLLTLPWAYYTEFAREHAYGLSNQTLGKWASDAAKGLLVGLVAGVLFVWVPFLLLKKSPRRWWLYTALATVPFIVLMLLVAPIWIEPLFNDFGPMKDKTLERDILALADRAGIEGGRVFEVNKSVDTKAVDAYVTGFGETKRIVLWDTILAKLDRRELLFVMGHEMGHYVLGHIPKSIAFFSLVILLTLYVAHRTAGWFLSRFRARLGFDSLADVAALPLLLLLTNAFSLVVTPPLMAFSRYQEHQADQFGLEITHDNHAAATAFVKLQVENLGNPRPGLLYKLWRSSHPPVGERIDFCNTYHPWEQGKPGEFEKLFATPRVSSFPVTPGVRRQSPLAGPPAVSSPQNRSTP
jgi:STE24 endopeptidase